jgi:hypothetical protein
MRSILLRTAKSIAAGTGEEVHEKGDLAVAERIVLRWGDGRSASPTAASTCSSMRHELIARLEDPRRVEEDHIVGRERIPRMRCRVVCGAGVTIDSL